MTLFRIALLTTTGLVGLVGATAATAAPVDGPIATAAQVSAPSTQSVTGIDRAQPQARRDRADVTTTDEVNSVVVTGSRIAKPNLDQPTPVSVLSPQQIANAGTGNLADIIAQLPSVGFTGTLRGNSNNFGNGGGLSELNLRNLGTSRTLVLVDGQRHVPGDISNGAVDINSIPTALVDHVEVVTGGASAIYGSDAVSGVVNIILKKNFEGVEVQAEAGGHDNGFGAQYSVYGTVGHNYQLGDGKLNLTATAYWTKQEGIDARNIPTAHNYGTIANPNDVAAGTFDPSFYSSGAPIRNDGIPDRLYVQNVGSDLLSRGGVLIDTVNYVNTGLLTPLASFNGAGQIVPPVVRSGYNSASFAQLPANCGVACYFTEDYEQLQTPLDTKGADFTAHYDVNSHLHFSLDAKYAESDADDIIQPSFSFGDFQLQRDNAFITPEVQSLLNNIPEGLEPLIGKFVNDGRINDARRQTYRIVVGASGDFDAGFAKINWDGALNYGLSVQRYVNSNILITQNFNAALDSVIDPATGQAACRVNVPSANTGGLGYGATPLNPSACVPYNPFGTNNNAAVFDYISGTFITRDHLSQQVANLNGGFDTSRFFNLQGGPLAFAFGGEYRMERTYETNDPFASVPGNTESLYANSAGGFNVYEGYIEANAPVFRHFRPGLDELTFDAAYRASYYSTVGHTDAYKFSGVYGPFRDIKFRGTYSRAVRAPNITEAFLPATPGFFTIVDPCDKTNITSNVNYPANCAAAGVPANFNSNTNVSIQGTTSGNPNLDAEKAISYTGGIVLQPRWIPRFSLTLDYFSIKIKNAITNVPAQNIINNCYNGAMLDPQYCSLFTRGADGNIDSVSTTYVNASKLQTDGIDLQTNYTVGVDGLTNRFAYTRFMNEGRLSFNVNATYLIKLRNFPFQNIPTQVNIQEGTANAPRLRGLADLTYQQGGLQLSWQAQYLGRTVNFNRDSTAADHSESSDIPFNKQEFTHNIVARYDIGGRFKGTQVFVGVNNVFDDQPPGYLVGTGSDLGYDLGRYIFGGIKIRR